MATNAGLVRFDGVAFTTFNALAYSGLASDRVTELVLDGDRLWVGTREGISYVEDGQLFRAEEYTGTTAGMMSAPGGGLWIGNEDIPLQSTAGSTEPLEALNAAAQSVPMFPLICRDGSIWASDGDIGRLLRWDPVGKRINDLHGHVAGDACLKELTSRLQGVPRRALDLVARYGGEEFAIVLPDTDNPGALTIARRVWSVIRDQPFDLGKGLVIDVTVSVGVVSVVPTQTTEPRDLVTGADRALYQANKSGRDRIDVEIAATEPDANSSDGDGN